MAGGCSLLVLINHLYGGAMSRLKLVMLIGVAVVMITSLSPAAASAVKFEWSVRGTPLAAGQKSTIVLKPRGTIILKGTAFSVFTELEASKFKSEGNIQGGKPGTGEDVIEFTGITVKKPKSCTVANLKTERLESTIVKSLSEQIYILMGAVTGSTLAKLLYEGEQCMLKGDTVDFLGHVLVLPLPTPPEVELPWPVVESGVQSISSTGTVATNNLQLEGSTIEPASITGTLGALLEDDQVFSAL
jgi:hypothetical protein